jgi:hypothetical protein
MLSMGFIATGVTSFFSRIAVKPITSSGFQIICLMNSDRVVCVLGPFSASHQSGYIRAQSCTADILMLRYRYACHFLHEVERDLLVVSIQVIWCIGRLLAGVKIARI